MEIADLQKKNHSVEDCLVAVVANQAVETIALEADHLAEVDTSAAEAAKQVAEA